MPNLPDDLPTRRAVLRALGSAAFTAVAVGCNRVKSTDSRKPSHTGVGSAEGITTSGLRPASKADSPAPDSPAPDSPAPPVSQLAVLRGTLLGVGAHSENGRRRNYVSLVDLDRSPLRSERLRTPFFGHGFAFDPRNPNRAILFEKHGPGCCELDFLARKVVRSIPTTADRQFYGHGVFTADGALLLATETVVGDGSKRGVIVVRDGRTLKPMGIFPSYGEAPHDCWLIDSGRTLVVTNGGGTKASGHVPNIAYIDVASRRLKERVAFDDPRVNAGHLAVSPTGDLVVVSAPRDGLDLKAAEVHGAISFRPAGSKGPLRIPKVGLIDRMRAETLSVTIHAKNGVVAATSPIGNLVSFWDVKTGKLMSSLDSFKQPRGITVVLDGSCFALTWGNGASLVLIDAMTLQPMANGVLRRAWMSGSHVYVHRLTRTLGS